MIVARNLQAIALPAAELNEAVRCISDRISLAAVWLYGSHARGDAHADSDVDLAILTIRPVSQAVLLEALFAVQDVLSRDVDLVDLATAPTILQHRVLADGLRLAAPDPFRADLFELEVAREYEDFKRRRAPLEADIAARGRVFAA